LVGGNRSALFPSSKLTIWDDFALRTVAEFQFSEEIKSLKLRSDMFSVVLSDKIHVFNMSDMFLKDTISTFFNPKGICSVSATGSQLIAYPDTILGSVAVKDYTENTIRLIPAFDSVIACLEMNLDGSILACASDKGTLIRLFSTDSKELLYELRRGIDKAEIYSIAFHTTSEWVACSSDKGTVHIYSIGAKKCNGKSSLAFMKKVLPKYFESEWSYARFKIKGGKMICCFAKDCSSLVLLTDEGDYYMVDYSEPGECKKVEKCNLLDFMITY
jgi:WD repeat-containing protein 45